MTAYKAEIKFISDDSFFNLASIFDGEVYIYFRVLLFKLSNSPRNEIHPRRRACTDSQ